MKTVAKMCESVDDEAVEKFSVDSLEYALTPPKPAKSSPVVGQKPIRSCVPFRLHEEGKTRKHFVISYRERGEFPWKREIDPLVLTKKGLQLNEDGSFSKSPREHEDLPFVMSAPRVALIRRRRQDLKKHSHEVLVAKPSETGNLFSELSRMKSNGNLTDSMKEALYKKYPTVQNLQEKLKKLNGEENNKSVPVPVAKARKKKSYLELRLPEIEKPARMSYFERYQKKIGFDPRSISHKAQKEIEDTVRSNYGDTTRETISDVSDRFTVVDEEEELFYQRMMMNGNDLRLRSTSSDISGRISIESEIKKTVEPKKEVKMIRAKPVKSNTKASPKRGALSLGGISPIRKSTHSCPTEQEHLAKAELATKAKTYGNLANLRNIVKMQLRSCRREWITPEIREEGKSFLPPLNEGSSALRGRETLGADEMTDRMENSDPSTGSS